MSSQGCQELVKALWVEIPRRHRCGQEQEQRAGSALEKQLESSDRGRRFQSGYEVSGVAFGDLRPGDERRFFYWLEPGAESGGE